MARARPQPQEEDQQEQPRPRYQLLERVATGGMAELFKARVIGPEGFDKLVAVKRILPDFSSNEEFVRMFIDEARLAANLNHPNVVQVFELGRDIEQNLFITMELVHGPELATVIYNLRAKRRRLPEAAALEIVIQMLRGLHHAHTKTDIHGNPMGLVHRDVSPQNLLVTTEGVAKLLDFGVAKAKGRLTETQAGMVKGKLIYMSPEQSRNRVIDARSDQFAVGLVLWECLVGEPCYTFKTEMQLLKAVANGGTRTMEQMGLSIDPVLEAALVRSLEPDPDARFPNCEEFADELLRFKQRTYPSFTPTMLGKLISDSCPEEVAKLTSVPDLDSPDAIPLYVDQVEMSDFASATKFKVPWKLVLTGIGVGVVGLAVGGGVLYYHFTTPVAEKETVYIHDTSVPAQRVTYKEYVQVQVPVPVPVPAAAPDAGTPAEEDAGTPAVEDAGTPPAEDAGAAAADDSKAKDDKPADGDALKDEEEKPKPHHRADPNAFQPEDHPFNP
jgi:serine/threonine protein kinase